MVVQDVQVGNVHTGLNIEPLVLALKNVLHTGAPLFIGCIQHSGGRVRSQSVSRSLLWLLDSSLHEPLRSCQDLVEHSPRRVRAGTPRGHSVRLRTVCGRLYAPIAYWLCPVPW